MLDQIRNLFEMITMLFSIRYAVLKVIHRLNSIILLLQVWLVAFWSNGFGYQLAAHYNTLMTRFGTATKFRPWDLSFDRFWPMGIRHTITLPSSHWLIDWIGSSKTPLQSIYLSVCRHYFYTPPPPQEQDTYKHYILNLNKLYFQ